MTRAHEVQKMTWKLGFCCFDKNLNHSHELFYLNLKVFFIIKINFQYLNLQYAKTELSYQLSKHILESKSSTLYCCTSVRLGLLFPKNLSSTSVWKKKDTCFMNIMVAASNNQMLITSLKLPVFDGDFLHLGKHLWKEQIDSVISSSLTVWFNRLLNSFM